MLHTIQEAIALTGKSRRTLYNHCDQGRLSYSLGHDERRYFETSELIRVYGNLLKERIAKGGVTCWLVNTGWTGGKATDPGIKRMPIKATRALLNAALDGSLNDAEFRKDPNFGFEFPIAVPGVDSKILDPREAWSDKAAYDATAQKLVQAFIDNFEQFEQHVDAGVREAAPKAA